MRRLLIDLDYRFGKLHIVGKLNDANPEGRASIRKVVVEFAYVLRKQREATQPGYDVHELCSGQGPLRRT